MIYAQNEKLTADHIEKMFLLFDTFEVKNGARAERYNRCIASLISSLTPERINRLADKHDIAPQGLTPWHKGMVGGSDDHGTVKKSETLGTIRVPENLLKPILDRL